MKSNLPNPTVPSRKLKDGLYKFANDEWIWIKDGSLYLSAKFLHPLELLTSGRPFVVVEDDFGKHRAFIRAAHLMEERPSLSHLIKQVAAFHQVSL